MDAFYLYEINTSSTPQKFQVFLKLNLLERNTRIYAKNKKAANFAFIVVYKVHLKTTSISLDIQELEDRPAQLFFLLKLLRLKFLNICR